jgi:T-complex protein 1 subunit delta
MVSLPQAQYVAAGSGTTSIVIFAGMFRAGCNTLLEKVVGDEGLQVISAMKIPFSSADGFTAKERQIIVNSATTSLNSKLASQWADVPAPLMVDTALRVFDGRDVSLNDIRSISTPER